MSGPMPDPYLWWEPKWLPSPQELARLGVRPPVPRRDPAVPLARRRRVPVLRAGRRAGRGRGL